MTRQEEEDRHHSTRTDRIELRNALGRKGTEHTGNPLAVLPESQTKTAFGDIVDGHHDSGVMPAKRSVELQS